MGAGASASVDSISRVEAVFAVIDTNASGDLNAAEIVTFIKGSGLREWTAAAKGEEWLARFDGNNDNKATVEEFKGFFSSHLEQYGDKTTEELLAWFEELGKKMVDGVSVTADAPSADALPVEASAVADVGADMRLEAATVVAVGGGFISAEPPAAEAPAAAPAAETTPAAETPAAETTPAAEITSPAEAPAAETTPTAETTPAAETPAAETTPAAEAPAVKIPAAEAPAAETTPAAKAAALADASAEMRSEATAAVEVNGAFVPA